MAVYRRSKARDAEDDANYASACSTFATALLEQAAAARQTHEDLSDYNRLYVAYEAQQTNYEQYLQRKAAWDRYQQQQLIFNAYPAKRRAYEQYKQQLAQWQNKQAIAAVLQGYCVNLVQTYVTQVIPQYFLTRANKKELAKLLGVELEILNQLAEATDGQAIYFALSKHAFNRLIVLATAAYNEIYETQAAFDLASVLADLGSTNQERLDQLQERWPGASGSTKEGYAIALLDCVRIEADFAKRLELQALLSEALHVVFDSEKTAEIAALCDLVTQGFSAEFLKSAQLRHLQEAHKNITTIRSTGGSAEERHKAMRSLLACSSRGKLAKMAKQASSKLRGTALTAKGEFGLLGSMVQAAVKDAPTSPDGLPVHLQGGVENLLLNECIRLDEEFSAIQVNRKPTPVVNPGEQPPQPDVVDHPSVAVDEPTPPNPPATIHNYAQRLAALKAAFHAGCEEHRELLKTGGIQAKWEKSRAMQQGVKDQLAAVESFVAGLSTEEGPDVITRFAEACEKIAGLLANKELSQRRQSVATCVSIHLYDVFADEGQRAQLKDGLLDAGSCRLGNVWTSLGTFFTGENVVRAAKTTELHQHLTGTATGLKTPGQQ